MDNENPDSINGMSAQEMRLDRNAKSFLEWPEVTARIIEAGIEKIADRYSLTEIMDAMTGGNGMNKKAPFRMLIHQFKYLQSPFLLILRHLRYFLYQISIQFRFWNQTCHFIEAHATFLCVDDKSLGVAFMYSTLDADAFPKNLKKIPLQPFQSDIFKHINYETKMIFLYHSCFFLYEKKN